MREALLLLLTIACSHTCLLAGQIKQDPQDVSLGSPACLVLLQLDGWEKDKEDSHLRHFRYRVVDSVFSQDGGNLPKKDDAVWGKQRLAHFAGVQSPDRALPQSKKPYYLSEIVFKDGRWQCVGEGLKQRLWSISDHDPKEVLKNEKEGAIHARRVLALPEREARIRAYSKESVKLPNISLVWILQGYGLYHSCNSDAEKITIVDTQMDFLANSKTPIYAKKHIVDESINQPFRLAETSNQEKAAEKTLQCFMKAYTTAPRGDTSDPEWSLTLLREIERLLPQEKKRLQKSVESSERKEGWF